MGLGVWSARDGDDRVVLDHHDLAELSVGCFSGIEDLGVKAGLLFVCCCII